MFDNITDKRIKNRKIKKVTKSLNANSNSHARHFDYNFCKDLGLSVELLNNDEKLLDIVMQIYFYFQIISSANKISKIICNQLDVSYIQKYFVG